MLSLHVRNDVRIVCNFDDQHPLTWVLGLVRMIKPIQEVASFESEQYILETDASVFAECGILVRIPEYLLHSKRK